MSGSQGGPTNPPNGVVAALHGISVRVSDLGKDIYETLRSGKTEEEGNGTSTSNSYSVTGLQPEELQTQRSVFLPDDEEGAQLFRDKALDALPVENAIFWQHTRCLGLFFRTLRVERMFLDGLAKLERKVVYLGYCLITAISFLGGLRGWVQEKYREMACPPEYDEFCGNDGTTAYFVQITYGYYFSAIFPTLAVFTLVGCSVHW